MLLLARFLKTMHRQLVLARFEFPNTSISSSMMSLLSVRGHTGLKMLTMRVQANRFRMANSSNVLGLSFCLVFGLRANRIKGGHGPYSRKSANIGK